MTPLLIDLLQELDSPLHRFGLLRAYLTNTQPLAWISPESRRALGDRLTTMASNIPELAVASLVERLRVSGFSDPRAWTLFQDSDLDQMIGQAFSDALAYGNGYLLVWGKDGQPVASVESPFQCTVLRDPGTRDVIAGVKRYRTKTTTEVFVYTATDVQHWRASSPGAGAGFTLVETTDHNLGVCPLVPVDNGHSELDSLIPLCDALNKLLSDLMVASEAAGKPRRWISGLELTERPRMDDDGNPVLDGNGHQVIDVVSPIDDVNVIQTMVSEHENTKFGQLPASDLSGFKDGVQVLISQIMAVSALPSHYLGILTAQPSSADALRASEAALTARAEARQLTFGRAVELVGKLLLAVKFSTAASDFPLRVQWADAATRSVAQEADAVVKLFQSGLLPASYALARLGYSADEIIAIRSAKRAEFLDGQGVGVTLPPGDVPSDEQ